MDVKTSFLGGECDNSRFVSLFDTDGYIILQSQYSEEKYLVAVDGGQSWLEYSDMESVD